MKIGIIGIVQNPSRRLTSHNAGWTYALRSQLRNKYNTDVDILTEKDEWNDYDILYITEGVNYRHNVWNLFGGVSPKLVERINKLLEYKRGDLYFYGDQAPDYMNLVKSRNLLYFEDLLFPPIKAVTTIVETDNIVIGDSHAISVYEDDYNIQRHDGQTLHGALRKGLHTYLDKDKVYNKVRFYFGNIDVRHHLCRLYPDKDRRIHEIKVLVGDYLYQCEKLIKNGNCKQIEIVSLLPIENESRKIPKTGYYDGKPFWGSQNDRIEAMTIFNVYMHKQLILNKYISIVLWDKFESSVELNFKNMEQGQSVHLAPHSYMHNFINDKKNTLWG